MQIDADRGSESKTPVTVRSSDDSSQRSPRCQATKRAANSTKQAQSVLLQKLGIAVSSRHSSDTQIQGDIPQEPLSGSKQQALQMMFSAAFDEVAMNLDMAGLLDADAV
jgi:hypothetical protein